MSQRKHRSRGIVSRAACCQVLERRMLLSLSPVGAEFRVNTVTTSDQSVPAVAADADGDFVVAWSSYYQDGSLNGIFARRYNAAGTALGAEFRVNTFTTGAQRFPSVAMDADGDFVIAWDSAAQDGSVAGIFAQRYNSMGVAQSSEFRVNTFTTGEQFIAQVAMDAGGDFVVTWSSLNQDGSNAGVYAQRYNALGVVQGGEFRVNTFTTANQNPGGVAMDASGDFVIAWSSSTQDPDGSDGVYAQRYDALGVAQGSEFRVNTVTTGNQSTPAVAMDSSGDFVVAWNSGFDIFAQRYNAAGVAQGGEFRANSFFTGAQSDPTVGMDADGDFLVTWTDGFTTGQDGSGFGVYAQSFSAAGAPQSGEFRVNTFTTGGQFNSAVALDGDGDAVVVWQSEAQDGSSNGVYAQRYDQSNPDTAAPVVAHVFVSGKDVLPYSTHHGPLSQIVVSFSENVSDAGGPTGPNSVTNPANWLITRNGASVTPTITYGFNPVAKRFEAVLSLPQPSADGNFLLKARDNIRDIAGNRLDGNLDGTAGGSGLLPFSVGIVPRGNEFRANTVTAEDQESASVAMDADGRFVIAWHSDGQDEPFGGVYMQRYDATGGPLGPERIVNTFTTLTQNQPSVAVDADGDFVVAWASFEQDSSGYGVYAQRFNALGVAQGVEFRVNTFITGNQDDPVVAMDADGDFVVVWHSYLQDGSSFGVYARRYNAAGVPQGTEFRVNTFTTGSQVSPSLAMDASGDFVVAWVGAGATDSSGVFAQRYNAAGVPQGGEFQVNATTTGSQGVPAASMDADGDFLVAWQSPDGSSNGVFAQSFNASGIAQGGEFRVNSTTTGAQTFPAVATDADGDFVVTWHSEVQTDQFDVHAQRYSSSGVALGGEFKVNTFTANDQRNPSVAMDAMGDFVIAWESFQDGDQTGIYAQRYGIRNTTVVTTLSDIPDPVTGGNSITLSASGVSSDGGTVSSVSFYRESNGEPGLQVGVEGDTLVGTDTTEVGGFWSVSASTVGLGNGTYTYWAQANDNANLIGTPASTTNTVINAPPTVSASDFRFDTAPHRLQFTFNDNVSASLGTNDIVLENLTTQQTIPSTDLSLSYDTGTNTATFSYIGSGNLIDDVLPDGNYRATLIAAGITNAAGTPLAQNHIFNFFFLNGDANHDGRANLLDFNILAANFGQSPRTFSQGDFNYDSIVNLSDFNILASRFGQVLAAEPFGSNSIGGTRNGEERQDALDALLA